MMRARTRRKFAATPRTLYTSIVIMMPPPYIAWYPPKHCIANATTANTNAFTQYVAFELPYLSL